MIPLMGHMGRGGGNSAGRSCLKGRISHNGGHWLPCYTIQPFCWLEPPKSFLGAAAAAAAMAVVRVQGRGRQLINILELYRKKKKKKTPLSFLSSLRDALHSCACRFPASLTIRANFSFLPIKCRRLRAFAFSLVP